MHTLHIHDVEACKRGDEERPGSSANLDCFLVAMHYADLQTDPVASDVSEPRKGLYGDVDGSLCGCINQRWRRGVRLRRKEGRKIRCSPLPGRHIPFVSHNSMSGYEELKMWCSSCFLGQTKRLYTNVT